MAENDPANFEVANTSQYLNCTLAIANNTDSEQRIKEVSFIYNSPRSPYTTVLSSSAKNSGISMHYREGTKKENTCLGKSLPKGGICFVRFQQNALPWGGRIGLCTGKIVVEDVNPAVPGSLIASGAVVLNQEAMVLGGQLSGAFYASQTHVQTEDLESRGGNVADRGIEITGKWDQSQNMNTFCTLACQASQAKDFSTQASKASCDEHCGISGRGSDPVGWTRHIRGWSTPDQATSFFSNDGGSPARYTATPAVQFHGITNGHYAGGMVYEMNVGASSAICSGNVQYFLDGGTDFSHADGVDSHAVYSSNVTTVGGRVEARYPGAPPERLVCSHRHVKPDLFMRVGASNPVVVNGGSPF